MPIYEFTCESCGHRFERMQSMSAADPSRCPQCSEPEIRRLMSLSSFQLKGSGWYVTDYKGKTPAASTGNRGSTKCDDSSCPAKEDCAAA